MQCPMRDVEAAGFLLDYCAQKLSPQDTAIVERHLEICETCRDLVAAQRGLWDTLDCWEPVDVSPDFDRRLYARIEAERGSSAGRLFAFLKLVPEVADRREHHR